MEDDLFSTLQPFFPLTQRLKPIATSKANISDGLHSLVPTRFTARHRHGIYKEWNKHYFIHIPKCKKNIFEELLLSRFPLVDLNINTLNTSSQRSIETYLHNLYLLPTPLSFKIRTSSIINSFKINPLHWVAREPSLIQKCPISMAGLVGESILVGQ